MVYFGKHCFFDSKRPIVYIRYISMTGQLKYKSVANYNNSLLVVHQHLLSMFAYTQIANT